MSTLHIISDLNLQFNEFTPFAEEKIPDVDLVILNDNIASTIKRGFLYVESLCFKYPDIQFVYNLGFNDLYDPGHIPKNDNEIVAAVEARIKFNKSWPKNLHSFYERSKEIQLRNGEIVDIFCSFGFPNIVAYEGAWEDHIWWRDIIYDVVRDINDPRAVLPANTSRVDHGWIPLWATQEWINSKNLQESNLIKTWLLNNENKNKILVTTINPVNDSRCIKQTVKFFNLNFNGTWISSNTKLDMTYNGARLITNPGRGEAVRSLVITL